MPDSLLPLAIFASFAASLFGLVVGSFANVVIHRLPREESIVFPSSRCPRCGAAIRPWQNIPVISWLLLRGRCASCREPISARYPAVELLHGAGFGLLVWNFGPRPFTLLLLVFFFALVVLAFIDWDHQILPDVITLPGILAGGLGSLIPGALIDWRESLLAALLGYVAFFLVAEGYARLRGIEGLGQGDWKLAAMMGSFLGGQRLMLTVFLASLSGMTYGLIQATRLRREMASSPAPEPSPEMPAVEETAHVPVSIGRYKLPFGTFLAGSAILVLFCGDPMLRWYASFFRFHD
jgi:leader peptidase (prepilin peptidase)/N-methyltransferase